MTTTTVSMTTTTTTRGVIGATHIARARRDTASRRVAHPTKTSSSLSMSASAKRRTRRLETRASSSDDDVIDAMGAPGEDARAQAPAPAPATAKASQPVEEKRRANVRRAESTDAVATFMTRRFGLKGGLAWLGVLTFGVVSEQLKTRRETREAIVNTRGVDASERREVSTAGGTSYVDIVVGGGERVAPQYLLAAHVEVKITNTGEVVFDTRKKGRQVVWSYGGRLGGAITRGVEDGVAGMRQGGRRVIKVPASLAFGDDGAVLGDNIVRPGTDLTYDVELTRVSIPPS